MMTKLPGKDSGYHCYDQAIKRIVVILTLLKQRRDPAMHFESTRQFLEGAPWDLGESNRAFRQLSNAHQLVQHNRTRSAPAC